MCATADWDRAEWSRTYHIIMTAVSSHEHSQFQNLGCARPFAWQLTHVPLCILLLAYRLGLPTSSSQCITGGIVGVGLMEGIQKGVNWKMFAKQFGSWVSTLFVVGLATAAIFAQVRMLLGLLLVSLAAWMSASACAAA
jgi:phosphate/sulfate permease